MLRNVKQRGLNATGSEAVGQIPRSTERTVYLFKTMSQQDREDFVF